MTTLVKVSTGQPEPQIIQDRSHIDMVFRPYDGAAYFIPGSSASSRRSGWRRSSREADSQLVPVAPRTGSASRRGRQAARVENAATFGGWRRGLLGTRWMAPIPRCRAFEQGVPHRCATSGSVTYAFELDLHELLGAMHGGRYDPKADARTSRRIAAAPAAVLRAPPMLASGLQPIRIAPSFGLILASQLSGHQARLGQDQAAVARRT